MIALCTSKARVILAPGAPPSPQGRPAIPRGAPAAPGRPRARGAWGALLGPPSHSVMRREELHDEGRHAVLHLGERHRIDDLVADAVVVLSAEVRLAPQVVELDDAESVRHLLRIGALRLLQRGDECEGR